MDRTQLPTASSASGTYALCGCSFINVYHHRFFLPVQELSTHVTILNNVATTRLVQVFQNPTDDDLAEAEYSFPLYDGVSVGRFSCTVGENAIRGVVKPKEEARATYDSAVAKGETAALLTQSMSASDVFTTSIGNIPAYGTVKVEITYFGELTFDAQVGGVRYMIPTAIAPRYGDNWLLGGDSSRNHSIARGMSITVDINLPAALSVQRILSPSHPIDVSIGRLSGQNDGPMSLSKASARLSLEYAVLSADFIIQVVADGFKTPFALLEDHPSIPGQRALMISAVPDFKLPPTRPEILFVCDRSGSMAGSIQTLQSALNVFLKSLPVGVYFNLVSFGSHIEFLWPHSRVYSEKTLKAAQAYVNLFAANFGGTETRNAIEATTRSQSISMPTEVILLTDGDITNQQALFDFISRSRNEASIRYFCLGIGSGVSSALVGGVSRAGGGFSEYAANGEPMDARLVNLLKGALSPHLGKAALQIKWDDDEYDIVDNISEDLSVALESATIGDADSQTSRKEVSYFTGPSILQTPSNMPSLFASTTFTAFLLLSPKSELRHPTQVTLRATSDQGPVEIDVPVEQVGRGELVHQLAARKAMQELEEGHGWIQDQLEGTKHQFAEPARKPAELEATRLGVTFQVLGKHCSFVAVNDTTLQYEETIRSLRSKVNSSKLTRVSSHGSQDKDDDVDSQMVAECETLVDDNELSGFGRVIERNSIPAKSYGQNLHAMTLPSAGSQADVKARRTAKSIGAGGSAVARYEARIKSALSPKKKMSSTPASGGLFGQSASSAQPVTMNANCFDTNAADPHRRAAAASSFYSAPTASLFPSSTPSAHAVFPSTNSLFGTSGGFGSSGASGGFGSSGALGGFGSSGSSASGPQSTGGLFGSSSSNAPPATASPGTSFDAIAKDTHPGGSLFGTSSSGPQPAAAPAGGLFGTSRSSPQPAAAPTKSLFGVPSADPQRGIPSAAYWSTNLFGGPPTQADPRQVRYFDATSSSGPSTTGPLFGAPAAAPSPQGGVQSQASDMEDIPSPSFSYNSDEEEVLSPSYSYESQASNTTKPKDPRPVFEVLVNNLTFEGCWKAAALPYDKMNLSQARFAERLQHLEENWRNTTGAASLPDGLATACALAFLEARMPAERARWELLADKAREWLARTFADPAVVEALTAEAQVVVGGSGV